MRARLGAAYYDNAHSLKRITTELTVRRMQYWLKDVILACGATVEPIVMREVGPLPRPRFLASASPAHLITVLD